MRGLKISQVRRTLTGFTGQIRDLSTQLESLRTEYSRIPAKVPFKQLVPDKEIRRLKIERKILVDTLKMQAYLAEDLMIERLSRHDDDPMEPS